jgi:ABC-type multidrug transport system permease subunit
MELDDIKKTWEAYDKKLSDSLQMNETLLRKLNLNTTRKEMQKLLGFEIFNIICAVAILLVVGAITNRYFLQPKFSIPGFIIIMVDLVYLVFGVKRTRDLLAIDYYSSSVVKLQKDVLTAKKRSLYFRKFEILLLPFFLLPMMPLLFKLMHNIDVYANVSMILVNALIMLAIAYPILLWIYKYFYDKKFKSAERLLAELKQFEHEE